MAQWLSRLRRRSSAWTPPTTKKDGAESHNTPDTFHRRNEKLDVPETQTALFLHAIRTPYEVGANHPIPDPQHDHELLVKVIAVGLNPIDWKAPAFNFGIPQLPYISGRELVGTVVKAPSSHSSSSSNRRPLVHGDLVIIPSTDYRDLRKAAFQEYAVASSFNAIRLPLPLSPSQGATLGVAFVAASLALGICMGLDFSEIENGPDLLDIVREKVDPERLASDIRQECLEGISHQRVDGGNGSERAAKGDFVVIWGGSATCAHTFAQLARLAGLKVISVVDVKKHGVRLSGKDHLRPVLLVDGHDPERAIEIIRAATEESGGARFGFDTQGKETAAHLLRALAPPSEVNPVVALPEDLSKFEGQPTHSSPSKLPTPPSTPSPSSYKKRAHLVGLTGVPKSDSPPADVVLHNVPIKLFHEVPEVGEALSAWCERLLLSGRLVPPDVVGTVGGLEGVEGGLGRLKRREVSGGRVVAVLE